MNETKFEWSDLSLFLSVARRGGLAGSSIETGISAPTLGRHMAALERAIGEILFNRMPRGYELTLAGKELFEEAEVIEQQILSIERRRGGGEANLPIQISAGSWMSMFLAQNINEIAVKDARLIFRASEAKHDLGRREATIGIRNARPLEEGLAARKTCSVKFASYATSAGAKLDDWIATTAQTPSAQWVRGSKLDKIKIEVSSPRSLLDLAINDAGWAVLPCFIGDVCEALIRGEIIEELTHDQWLVVHGEDRNQPQVRKTVDKIGKLIFSNKEKFEGAL